MRFELRAGARFQEAVRPTLRIASNNRSGRPHREFTKIDVTESAIATIAHTGYTRPVVARGTPMPLKRKASTTFCLVLR